MKDEAVGACYLAAAIVLMTGFSINNSWTILTGWLTFQAGLLLDLLYTS